MYAANQVGVLATKEGSEVWTVLCECELSAYRQCWETARMVSHEARKEAQMMLWARLSLELEIKLELDKLCKDLTSLPFQTPGSTSLTAVLNTSHASCVTTLIVFQHCLRPAMSSYSGSNMHIHLSFSMGHTSTWFAAYSHGRLVCAGEVLPFSHHEDVYGNFSVLIPGLWTIKGGLNHLCFLLFPGSGGSLPHYFLLFPRWTMVERGLVPCLGVSFPSHKNKSAIIWITASLGNWNFLHVSDE